MQEEAKAPAGMVFVDLRSRRAESVSLYGLTNGFELLPRVPLTSYWIDRYEVTNRQFKQFVDQGGYQKQEYWKQAFVKDGQALSWEQAMALFRDTTGRPGPAGWLQSDYPPGQDDFPVSRRELV